MSDKPPDILGSDSGVSPAELTLAALTSCLKVGYAANATAMGIDLEEGNAHSPIWDTLANPVRVESRLEEPAGN